MCRASPRGDGQRPRHLSDHLPLRDGVGLSGGWHPMNSTDLAADPGLSQEESER